MHKVTVALSKSLSVYGVDVYPLFFIHSLNYVPIILKKYFFKPYLSLGIIAHGLVILSVALFETTITKSVNEGLSYISKYAVLNYGACKTLSNCAYALFCMRLGCVWDLHWLNYTGGIDLCLWISNYV